MYGVQPEMVDCERHIAKVFESFGYDCIPTSVVGKKHKIGSLHPVGFAKDFRTKHINPPKRIETIERILGRLVIEVPQCDFLFEHANQPQEHIHAEFDPKNDLKFQEHKARYKLTGNWPNRNEEEETEL